MAGEPRGGTRREASCHRSQFDSTNGRGAMLGGPVMVRIISGVLPRRLMAGVAPTLEGTLDESLADTRGLMAGASTTQRTFLSGSDSKTERSLSKILLRDDVYESIRNVYKISPIRNVSHAFHAVLR